MDLLHLMADALARQFEELTSRVEELAAPLSEEQFWAKALSFGNSFGHLALHLTGNLNYYIGAQIAHTGYVRDRPLEFTDKERPSKKEVLKNFHAAASMVSETIRSQSEDDWALAYSAKGEEDAENRLTIVLRCLAHLDHHLGQMQYLSFAMKQE
jgi:uncharacterized damage-inducible protein DinB